MSVTDLVRIARSRWVLIVGAVLVVVAATLVIGSWASPTYRSEARVRVTTTTPGVNLRYAYYGGALYRGLENSYSSVFAGPAIRDEVARRLGPVPPPPTAWSVASSVVVHSDDVTVIVAGESADPVLAARVAATAAGALTDTARSEAALTASRRDVDVMVGDPSPATAPVRLAEPLAAHRVVAAALTGLALGTAGALLLHRRRRRPAPR